MPYPLGHNSGVRTVQHYQLLHQLRVLLSGHPGDSPAPIVGDKDGFVVAQGWDELDHILAEVGEGVVQGVRGALCLPVPTEVHCHHMVVIREHLQLVTPGVPKLHTCTRTCTHTHMVQQLMDRTSSSGTSLQGTSWGGVLFIFPLWRGCPLLRGGNKIMYYHYGNFFIVPFQRVEGSTVF